MFLFPEELTSRMNLTPQVQLSTVAPSHLLPSFVTLTLIIIRDDDIKI